MPVFDVTQFGAIPIPGVDNYRAIQAAADAQNITITNPTLEVIGK